MPFLRHQRLREGGSLPALRRDPLGARQGVLAWDFLLPVVLFALYGLMRRARGPELVGAMADPAARLPLGRWLLFRLEV